MSHVDEFVHFPLFPQSYHQPLFFIPLLIHTLSSHLRVFKQSFFNEEYLLVEYRVRINLL